MPRPGSRQARAACRRRLLRLGIEAEEGDAVRGNALCGVGAYARGVRCLLSNTDVYVRTTHRSSTTRHTHTQHT